MAELVDRRVVFGVGLLPLLSVPWLSACGTSKDKHHHDKETNKDKDQPMHSAPMTPLPIGSAPDVVMIIRHAEKPNDSGTPYGITEDGVQDVESLTVRGWTRAGALVGLFDPRTLDGNAAPLRPGLSRPAAVIASTPNGKGSKRPVETVTPLAAALGTQIDQRFAKGQEAQAIAALAGMAGPVLISWQHESIGALIAQLGAIDPAPPADWPGDRFDIVYVFTRQGSGWSFTQVPQLLLAGDSATPIS